MRRPYGRLQVVVPMTDLTSLEVPQKSQGTRRLMNFRLSPLDIRNLEAVVRGEAKRGVLLSMTQAVQLALSEAAKRRK